MFQTLKLSTFHSRVTDVINNKGAYIHKGTYTHVLEKIII